MGQGGDGVGGQFKKIPKRGDMRVTTAAALAVALAVAVLAQSSGVSGKRERAQ